MVLFERNCHGIEKSEAIACARKCRSSRLHKRVVDPPKKNWDKNEGARRRVTRGHWHPPPKKKRIMQAELSFMNYVRFGCFCVLNLIGIKLKFETTYVCMYR
jgi:hypothetical protein